MKAASVLGVCVLLLGAGSAIKADRDDRTVIVTSSNAAANELLVFSTKGNLVQTVSTQGQGGVANNAGGVATAGDTVAVVNFGSQSVTIFDREERGFRVREIVPAASAPVSVAFGRDHLYVLGTTTVESHRIRRSTIEAFSDGIVGLLRGDGSSAQVGVVGDQLVISEKSGVIEVVDLREGAVVGSPANVEIPAGSDTPFGLVTRGNNGYVTIAHSDEISLIRNGRLVAIGATGSGFPNGPGQQAPCWITLVGPYLFTSNSPSHSISRLVATGGRIILDVPVAARTVGAPIDITTDGERIAVIEDNGNGQSHLTLFRLDDEDNLVRLSTTAIAATANGVAIVSGR